MKSRLILQGLAVAYVVAAMLSCDYTANNVQSSPPAYVVTSQQIYEECRNNEVAAKLKYQGKVIIVQGKVADFDAVFDESRAFLNRTGSGYTAIQVTCWFSIAEQTSVAQLVKGQDVRVKGVCDGDTQVRRCKLQ